MNNKGFTLIEVLAVLTLVSLTMVIVVSNFSSSMSLGKKEAYLLMKNNLNCKLPSSRTEYLYR